MQAIVGVFTAQGEAERAADRLRALLGKDQVQLLTPSATPQEVEAVPTTPDMPPVGKVLGGALGGALALGLAACFFLPGLDLSGLDEFTITGVVATLFAGFTGILLGAAVGKKLDGSTSEGLPEDELYVYKDALRKGRTVVIAEVADEDQEKATRAALAASAPESVDAADHHWWVGLQDDEELEYQIPQVRR